MLLASKICRDASHPSKNSVASPASHPPLLSTPPSPASHKHCRHPRDEYHQLDTQHRLCLPLDRLAFRPHWASAIRSVDRERSSFHRARLHSWPRFHCRAHGDPFLSTVRLLLDRFRHKLDRFTELPRDRDPLAERSAQPDVSLFHHQLRHHARHLL